MGGDRKPLKTFNHGKSLRTRRYFNWHPVKGLSAPLEVPRTPAIGDIDGDREPEIVTTAGEHVYAWNADGTRVKGFPKRVNPAFSRPRDINKDNHLKRGFIGSAVLADLNGDGRLDVIAAALDQHVYAWTGKG